MGKSCIYHIVNEVNGKRYVGRTSDKEKRCSRHFFELRTRRHHCIHLQRSFNKYGEENFRFEVVEDNLSEKEAITREQWYLDNNYDLLYNISRNSLFGGDLISYHPRRDEIVASITKSVRQRYANMSPEDRAELSQKLRGEGNPNYGNKGEKSKLYKIKKTSSHKQNISKALTGRALSKDHVEKMKKSKLGKSSWNKGLKTGSLSEKHKTNLSKALQGRENNHKKIKIVCENTIFDSVKQAADVYDVSSTAILQRLKSKSEKWSDFFYFDPDNPNHTYLMMEASRVGCKLTALEKPSIC